MNIATRGGIEFLAVLLGLSGSNKGKQNDRLV